MTDTLTPASPPNSAHTTHGETTETRSGASAPPPPPRRRSGWRRTAATAAVAALVGAGTAVPVTLALDEEPAPATPAAVAAAPDTSSARDGLAQAGGVAAIAAEVTPSVALVEVAGPQGQGSGSAVVYRDGHLLTNNHVVENAAQVRITLPDGTEESAEVVGTDPRSDLAVLQVERADLPEPRFADAGPQVGETAVAIGAPFGLDGSVTAGIVSALDRSVSTPGAPLVGMIQTDAPINPGNSGGALVDAEGRVMGINTAILSPTGSNNGIGFAIPIATAKGIADQIIADGSVDHAFLGVQGATVDPQIAAQYGLGVDSGAVLTNVTEGTPAAEAGLRQGDIVVAVDGADVESMADLAGRIAQRQPGDAVELQIVRQGEDLSVDVTLGEAPAPSAAG